MLAGRIDEKYVEYRLFSGKVHARLNIEPRWNVANYAMYLELIRKRLQKKIKGDKLAIRSSPSTRSSRSTSRS